MISTIWSGAGTGSDVLLLIAAIVAALDCALLIVKGAPETSLLPASIALMALGLLAL